VFIFLLQSAFKPRFRLELYKDADFYDPIVSSFPLQVADGDTIYVAAELNNVGKFLAKW
jgi:hypothetical protein